jgi:hypothetical protein
MRQLQPANARAYRLRFRGYTKGAKRRAQPGLFVVFFLSGLFVVLLLKCSFASLTCRVANRLSSPPTAPVAAVAAHTIRPLTQSVRRGEFIAEIATDQLEQRGRKGERRRR